MREHAAGQARVLVILDSNHTHEHVLEELELYSPLVTPGSYLVVFDTVIEDMPPDAFPDRPWGRGNNPKTAVHEFLARNDRFVIDNETRDKLLITVAPDGYLRCVEVAASNRIPIAGPWITEQEIEYVTDAATNAWYGTANMYHERFERAFAQYLGRRHAMALPSCTSALHLALAALGVGPGDEVVVPDVTWIASSAPITYVGATPVFADIDRDTWCLDAAALERRITPRTKAVIVVDLYGGMPDMDAIAEVAPRHGIAVIEDAAEAVGSRVHGPPGRQLRDAERVQLPRLEDADDRRGRHARHRRRRALRARAGAARSRPPAGRQDVLQHRGRLQVQDVEHAGRARPGAARAHRRAGGAQARDLRLVSRGAAGPRRSTARRPTSGTPTGWSRSSSTRRSASARST